MPNVTVQFTPPDLIKRMERYPDHLDTEVRKTHVEALRVLHKAIPPYPPPPPGSTYVRTEALGMGLGSGFGGGQVGPPSLYRIEKLGGGAYESAIGGVEPDYNVYVIDEQRQAAVHRGRWWTTRDWLGRAQEGIVKVFETASQIMAQFLEGKG